MGWDKQEKSFIFCLYLDLNEVKLDLDMVGAGGERKAYFQNGAVATAPGPATNDPLGKERLPGGIGGGKGTLFEDQNKNRVKHNPSMTTSPPTSITWTSPPQPRPINIIPNRGQGEGGDDLSKKKSESENSSNSSASPTPATNPSSANHVEIDIPPEQKPSSPLASNGNSGSNEIIKTRDGGGRGSFSSENDKSKTNGYHPHHLQQQNQRQHYEYEVEVDEYPYLPKHKPASPNANNANFLPSCEKDLEILKNVRKVYVQLADDSKWKA